MLNNCWARELYQSLSSGWARQKYLFRKVCDAAGLKGKSAHGIRKAAATADALAGWSDAELDAKFGWTGRRMASLYTRGANHERLSLAATTHPQANSF